jgi:hypothetical protein
MCGEGSGNKNKVNFEEIQIYLVVWKLDVAPNLGILSQLSKDRWQFGTHKTEPRKRGYTKVFERNKETIGKTTLRVRLTIDNR